MTDGTDDVPAGAPESYEAFTLPEGATFEGESLEQFQSFAKDLNLSQEQAQKLVSREFEVRQAAAPKSEAPEQYADFSVPEGVKLEGDDLKAVQDFAKDLGLTQEQAQKLVTRDFERQAAADQARAEAAEATRSEWEAAAKADKDYGGDKFEENLGIARKALDAFGDDELKAFLDLSGRGSHPAVIRAFIKVGKAISEDKLVPAGGQNESKSFYPNSNHAR